MICPIIAQYARIVEVHLFQEYVTIFVEGRGTFHVRMLMSKLACSLEDKPYSSCNREDGIPF